MTQHLNSNGKGLDRTSGPVHISHFLPRVQLAPVDAGGTQPSMTWRYADPLGPADPRVAVRNERAGRPCRLYLAVHVAHARFKIGISEDPIVRFQKLPEAGLIDLSVSVVYEFATRRRAVQVEKALHRALAPHMITSLPRGDGYTEWFELPAMLLARVILASIADGTQGRFPKHRAPRLPAGSKYLRTVEMNVAKVDSAVDIWRAAALRYPLVIHTTPTGQRTLTFRGYGRPGQEAGSAMRMQLQDVCGTYALRTLRTTRVIPSIVKLVRFATPDNLDLVIELQRTQSLLMVPGGLRVAQRLKDGLELLRLEQRVRRG